MHYRTRRRWRIIRDYWIGWILALMFLSVVRGLGTVELGSVQFELKTSLLVSVIYGFIFGSISGMAQILTEERIYQRISLFRLILFRMLYAVLFLAFLIYLSYLMVQTFFGIEIGFVAFAFEPGSGAQYFYIVMVDIFMLILRRVNLLLGDRKLTQLLLGRFYTPREEERIFMFLDLQSSTEIAERLGHIRYSQLLQDCFNDLGVVVQNEAEVYQYVGDEAVLTWTIREGLRNGNCLKAFYSFTSRLARNEAHYQKRYQVRPFFKAGVHLGQVTVTEVGKYKREIVYHGDTLNTAARIQAQCNKMGRELLISEELKTALPETGFQFEPMGDIRLRGKVKKVAIYAVRDPF